MIRALEEGQKAGGDKRGMQAAALLIVKKGAGYGGTDRYCDLRVDDHPEPIKELRRLYGVWTIRTRMLESFHLAEAKNFARAIEIGEELVTLDPSGDSHFFLACLLARAERTSEALARLHEAIARKPELAATAALAPDLEPLRNTDAFKRLVGR
jgi:hypothetical protein